MDLLKAAFFQKVHLEKVGFIFQISKMKIFKITILSLKFEFVVYCYWPDSDLEYFFWEI